SAAVDPVLFNLAAERVAPLPILGASHRNGVDVAVEDERSPAAGALPDADGVGPLRFHFEEIDLAAQFLVPLADEAAHGALATQHLAGVHARVLRVDAGDLHHLPNAIHQILFTPIDDLEYVVLHGCHDWTMSSLGS